MFIVKVPAVHPENVKKDVWTGGRARNLEIRTNWELWEL
jgi:hypothetical protein